MIGAFTDFADQGLLIPLEIAVFFVLLALGRPRDARAWGVAMAAGSLLILLLKLWFERCGVPQHRVIYSPSGHSMAGTMVYGGLLALFCGSDVVFACGVVLLAIAFATSRIALGVHTVPEVTLGGFIGLCVAVTLRRGLAREQAESRAALFTTLAVFGVLALALHGYRLGVERRIQAFAHAELGRLFCQGPGPGPRF
ncbi:hypothetical protein AA23498_3160 [Acetobacter nitrogenifigens DSM 23921 = NBRC 105050]|uniref:Phosphatidic acid phosphatase type 2/haloperoxidase domain-containing protein n=1 Tax=Acetobacter nitrogenifigens DSM 23921 = NBRC 105050 TaxID=1120919 RepID=A0A511X5I7_9PROT|nr:phosphatase PAP2 family protein [Acetobacter nitrogenifigens]GBQ98246.1 hypothetical protein AA23498_3160 [Acetobacter nitrogenifigens DSM 23921 = NBRC 105050]GEN58211.1 hypothetical protein ANI02nite_00950 [Acetobacter nitrogenifigens DSM 23921 = NBRC 105050]